MTESVSDKCPICLDIDKKENLFKLTCGHYIHSNCSEGLCELLCPLCRSEIKNFSDDTEALILKNKMIRREELVQEAEVEINNIIREEQEMNIEEEIEIARAFLIRAGVPEEIIPQFNIDMGNYPMIRGNIYRLIITSTLVYHEDLMLSYLNQNSDSSVDFTDSSVDFTESEEEIDF